MANTWCYILLVAVTLIAVTLGRLLFDEYNKNHDLTVRLEKMDVLWRDAMDQWKETLDISQKVNDLSEDLQKAGNALLEEMQSKEDDVK